MLKWPTGKSRVQPLDPVSFQSLTDKALIIRFQTGDEAAFAELVHRHATLVHSVCRCVLRNNADADDAFQATFLVLARKAGAFAWHESVAGWLFQTARRTSLKLRSMNTRRREVEEVTVRQKESITGSQENNPAYQASIHELAELLDTELARIPGRYREVILLTQVEGLTRDEVASRLGIRLGAVKDRLERGRELLRVSLMNRGVALSAAALSAWLIPSTAHAANLTAVTATTAQTAGAFASGNIVMGIAPTAVSLAQGILKVMGLEKLKYTVVCLLSLVTFGGLAFGMLKDNPTRFENGLCGKVVAVQTTKQPTITIALDETGTMLNLDISPQAKIWTAFEAGQMVDLKEGQQVSLRLSTDHRTVKEIHVQGKLQEARIQSVTPTGKLIIVDGDDDGPPAQQTEVELAPDAILRIGGLPASRIDLKPGMQVPLEFGRDGKVVNAIETEAAEKAMITGTLVDVINADNKIQVQGEDTEDQKPAPLSFTVTGETMIQLDGKNATKLDLKRGTSLILRLAEDGKTVRAIKATSPETEDDQREKDPTKKQ